MRTPMPLVAALSATTLALTACGAEEAGLPGASSPEGPETLIGEASDDDADDADEPTGQEPAEANGEAAGVEVSELELTECRSERFTVPYPRGWETDDDHHRDCFVFHPGEVELPEHAQDLDLHWAAVVYIDDVTWEAAQPDESHAEVLSSEEVEVDGLRASVHELRSRGSGLIPEGERRYSYAVDVGGQTLIAATHTVGDTDYERDREVLDRMMSSATIHRDEEATDDRGDPEEVGRHDTGQREFER